MMEPDQFLPDRLLCVHASIQILLNRLGVLLDQCREGGLLLLRACIVAGAVASVVILRWMLQCAS